MVHFWGEFNHFIELCLAKLVEFNTKKVAEALKEIFFSLILFWSLYVVNVASRLQNR